MLPFALYLICNTILGLMVDSYERRDGSVEYLPTQDLKRCIGARSELAWMLAGLVRRVFRPTSSSGCQSAAQCTIARRDILLDVEACMRGRCVALESFHSSVGSWAGEFGLCKVCKREMLAREVKERRRVWERLPGMFGVTDAAPGHPFISSREESSSDSDGGD